MSTLTFLALVDEERDLDLVAGLQRGGLGAAGGAVAGETRLGEGDDELDRGRQLDEEHAALVGGDDDVLVLQEEVLRGADDLRRDLELLVALDVHEDVGGAVVVEVLHRAAVDRRGLDLGAGVERLVDGLVGLRRS